MSRATHGATRGATHALMTTRYAMLFSALLVTALVPRWTQAQTAVADTVYLDDLQRAAETTDRRAAQASLIAQQSQHRLASLRSERLPTPTAVGSAQYLSDVPTVGVVLPSGAGIPTPYHEQFDTYLQVRVPLLDPTRASRERIEHAQSAESQARSRTLVWQQRAAVNDVFFGILLRDAQMASINATLNDLTARRETAAARVAAGAALRSEVDAIDAELTRRRQSVTELEIERAGALDILGSLTGQPLPATVTLSVRGVADTGTDVAGVETVGRPELQQFARGRELLEARRDAIASQDRPRISAFTRTGYGRPGLNQLGRGVDGYFTAGVQVEWTPFTWGRSQREREVQLLQSQVLQADEDAFLDAVQRSARAERARMTAMASGLAVDDTIIALRERVLTEARLRFDAGELSTPDYIARATELLAAQLDRDLRRVRLTESRARFLTTLGREVR